MRAVLAVFACLSLPVTAMADGAALAGAPDAPASLKPWGNDGAFCGASVEKAYPIEGVRVIRGRGPARPCDGATRIRSQPAGSPAIQVEQSVVFIERPYRWRSDFAASPRVLGAPRTRRY